MYIVNTVKRVILYGNGFIHHKEQKYRLKNVPSALVATDLLHEISHNYKISYIAFLRGVNLPHLPSWSSHGYPQTEGCNLDTTTNYLEHNSSFFNYMRMEPLMFDEILNRVSPRFQKSATQFRKELEPGLEVERIMR